MTICVSSFADRRLSVTDVLDARAGSDVLSEYFALGVGHDDRVGLGEDQYLLEGMAHINHVDD